MSKNFLLSKISVLTLTAVVLNSLIAPAWSMEDEKNSISHLTINHKNEDVSKNSTEESVGTNYFAQCPPEIKASILEIAAFDVGEKKKYLSIATGYRKVQTPANANKVEIWFTPRFLVDKEMPHLDPNHHMRAIIGSWDAARAPIGIFWTWGGWNATDHMAYCDYLTAESLDVIGSANLLKKALATRMAAGGPVSGGYTCCRAQYGGAERRRVHISFLN